jgi:hypothetical protein
MDEATLQRLQRMVLEALEERRSLIAYSRIEAVEMDRLAREYERKALDGIRAEIERLQSGGVALNLRNRLGRMDEQLAALEGQAQIAETSRRLQRDDITWRAFEDVASILGVEG